MVSAMDIDSLRALELFHGLTDGELTALWAIAEAQSIRSGTVLFEEDAPSTDLFVLVTGVVQIELKLHGKTAPEVLAQIRGKDLLGELALIDGNRRSATARAVADATVYRFTRDGLTAVMEQHPRLGFVLMKNLANTVASRLRTSNLNMRSLLSNQQSILSMFGRG